MGIRFKCPNGHALHVKSFLAGKKGVCPDCGARMRIPAESEPGLEKGKADDDEKDLFDADAIPPGEFLPATPAVNSPATAAIPPAVPVNAPAAVVPAAVTAVPQATIPAANIPAAQIPTAATAPTTFPTAVPVTPAIPVAAVTAVPVAPVTVVPAAPQAVPVTAVPVTVAGAVRPVSPAPPGMPIGGMTAAPPRPPLMAGGPLPPGLVDPVAEAPHAVWYVRPAAGGQYGPARGDVLRQWIQEGRLAGDSLVWREGWGDWKSAPEVFPELANSAPSIAGPALSIEGNSATRSADYLARKRSSNSTAIVMMALLAIICIGLFIALAYILSQNAKPRSPKASAKVTRSV